MNEQNLSLKDICALPEVDIPYFKDEVGLLIGENYDENAY